LAETPFDDLLAWLDSDRDAAARKYETIRTGLIRIFVAKGFSDAEDLADEVITRVSTRLPEAYVGEPAAYFHAFAKNVAREGYRRKEVATDEAPVSSILITNQSDEYQCLMRCLEFLRQDKRELILDYHVYEGHEKVLQHRIMAEELEISDGALRGRVHRIRLDLEECVRRCVETLRKQNATPQP